MKPYLTVSCNVTVTHDKECGRLGRNIDPNHSPNANS